MKRGLIAVAVAAALASGVAHATEGPGPESGFGRLDHVFLIIMENETDSDVLGNPAAPFLNAYARQANRALNYFAVGHPSAPNYLAIVGGSNFGLRNDVAPYWPGQGCIDHAPNRPSCVDAVAPISRPGTDNPVVATATGPGQCNGQVKLTPGRAPAANNCALRDYPAAPFTPKSIADQLVESHQRWKAYEESLPAVQPGVFGVNYSDGEWSNLSPPAVFAAGAVQALYAVKHDPFAYFLQIETGRDPRLSLSQVVDFDGPRGLWADLQSGAPALSVIVPNQCHDMHGFVAGGTPICRTATAAEARLLLAQGDAEVAKLVTGIKAAAAWKRGRNAIVVVWDENDFSNAPNRVLLLVETNYAANGRVSDVPYDHFSLLRTLEAAFDLPCLNHACDAAVAVMNDLFGGESGRDHAPAGLRPN